MSRIAVNKLANRLKTKEINVDVLIDRALDSFRNLSPSAVVPTTRDNGTPLQNGDTHFNETDGMQYIYKNSGWVSNDLFLLMDSQGAKKIGYGSTNVYDALDSMSTAIDSSVIVLTNYASLRAYRGNSKTTILSYRTVVGDKAGGTWIYTPTTTPVDNGITHIKDALNRQWVREEWDGTFVDARWAGALLDKTTDDTAAIQSAVNYCSTFTNKWPALRISGVARLGSPVIINRLVDTNSHEFVIYGNGSGGASAGFYVNTEITNMFDSTLTATIDPVSEFITFKDLQFETSSFFNNTRILSSKFLRIKNVNCFYWLIRYMSTTLYSQTHYFLNCNIRNNQDPFMGAKGSYDTLFANCVIENGGILFYSVDTDRGTMGLRIKDCVIEGIQGSIIVVTGCAGVVIAGNHIESCKAPNLNFFAGTMKNHDISIHDNYIYNPAGAFSYYGPTEKVISFNNSVSHLFHSNAVQVDLLTCCDSATNLSDVYLSSQAGGWDTNKPIKLSNLTSTDQTSTPFMGIGVPDNTKGKTGDFYFRTDTPGVPLQHLYVKQVAAWVPIL